MMAGAAVVMAGAAVVMAGASSCDGYGVRGSYCSKRKKIILFIIITYY